MKENKFSFYQADISRSNFNNIHHARGVSHRYGYTVTLLGLRLLANIHFPKNATHRPFPWERPLSREHLFFGFLTVFCPAGISHTVVVHGLPCRRFVGMRFDCIVLYVLQPVCAAAF